MFRRIAQRTGFLAHPSARGVHQTTTPLLGGAAIFGAFVVGMGVGGSFEALLPPAPTLGFLGGGLLIFAMGIIDDRLDLGWFSKLLGQIVAAVLLLASLNGEGAFLLSPLGLVLSLVWIVGLTNAMNFLDNMDGVCAGIAACVSMGFVGLAILNGQMETAVLAAAVGGASLGFLRFNFSPAKIFLGDGGSLFLGYSLAALGILATRETGFSLPLLIPVAVLAYPIFDITFVSITRSARGQSLAQGGKDHTSHRIARITGSDRLTALTIYGICITLGIVAMAVQALSFPPATIVGFASVLFGFIAFGVRLARQAPVPGDPTVEPVLSETMPDSLVPAGVNARVFETREQARTENGSTDGGRNGNGAHPAETPQEAPVGAVAGSAPREG
jgi:UDP-GlcNAc:undecaprenyl-phosphate GlcNAc-1-phosphate transferase